MEHFYAMGLIAITILLSLNLTKNDEDNIRDGCIVAVSVWFISFLIVMFFVTFLSPFIFLFSPFQAGVFQKDSATETRQNLVLHLTDPARETLEAFDTFFFPL